MARRDDGWLVPEVIDPPLRRCVTFYIPDEFNHIAAFWGAVNELCLWTNWQRTGDTAGTETAAVWREVVATARQNWLAGDCTLPLEFRVVDNTVEYRPDPNAAWQSIGVACACPPPYTSPEYNPDAPTFEDRACAIAVGLIVWMMDKYNDTLDIIEAAADTVSAMDAIMSIFPPAYIIADQILDAINEAIEAGVNIARAYETVERREAMSEYLYCAMIDTGEMTDVIWADFIAAFDNGDFGDLTPGGLAMQAYIKSFEVEAIKARSRIESYGEANCVAFDCGDGWTQIWDFIADQSLQGWETKGSIPAPTPTALGLHAAVYVDTGASPDSGVRRVQIGKTTAFADSTTRIQQMKIDYQDGAVGNSNVSPAAFIFPRVRLNESANIETAGNINLNLPDGITTGNFPGAATILNTYYALAGCQFAQRVSDSGQPVTGDGYVMKITISGIGKNPFVA